MATKRPIKSHTFIGKRWWFDELPKGQASGMCESPEATHRIMDIPLEGKTLNDCATVIHESLHACYWWMDEEFIDQAADDIARLLWRLGWRKQD